MSRASHVTRTKGFPPLVLFFLKFSASQGVWNCEFFSESPHGDKLLQHPSAAGVDAYNRGQERRGTKMRAKTHQDKVTIFQTALSEKIRDQSSCRPAQSQAQSQTGKDSSTEVYKDNRQDKSSMQQRAESAQDGRPKTHNSHVSSSLSVFRPS